MLFDLGIQKMKRKQWLLELKEEGKQKPIMAIN